MDLKKMLDNIEKFKKFGELKKNTSEDGLVYTPLEFTEHGFAIFSQEKYEHELKKLKECQFKHRYYYYEDLGNKNNKTDSKEIIFIMFNPSSACPHKDDPTIRNCRILANNNQYSSMEIINIFSERNPKVEQIDTDNNTGNKQFLESLLNNRADSDIVLAWGYAKENNGKYKEKIKEIKNFIKQKNKYIITINEKELEKVKTYAFHPGSPIWNACGKFINLAELTKLN